jgi:hypothetical protein
MRSLVALLAALGALAGAAAHAETQPAGKAGGQAGEIGKPARARTTPPYRLIRILPETHQALLLDRNRGRHVLVDAGDALGGFEVIEVGGDHVVLARPGDAREFVLVAGEAAPTSRLADPYPIPAPAHPASPLLDPYPPGVLDPYGSEGVRETRAPVADVRETRAPAGQRASEAPPAIAGGPPVGAPPVAAPPAPAPAAPPGGAPPTPPAAPPAAAPPTPARPAGAPPPPTPVTVSRAELNAGLGDFARIGRDVTMSTSRAGVKLERVAPGSFFHTMGLRDGDLVKQVDGTPIRGLDDAARVYARLGKLTRLTVEVERAGAPVTLRYEIR